MEGSEMTESVDIDIAAEIEASELTNENVSRSLLSNVPSKNVELTQEKPKVNERPEDWPEDLWDSEKGGPKLDAIKDRLNKSDTAYKELRKVLSDKKSFESYKKEQEGVDLSKQGVPEEYEFEGIDDTYLEDKETINYFSNAAKEAGLNNDQANKVLSKFIEQQSEKFNERRNNELTKMGEEGKQLISGIENFIETRVKRGTFTNQEAISFANLIVDADSAMAVSKLISMTGELKIPSKVHLSEHGRSESQIKEDMKDAHISNDQKKINELRNELTEYYAKKGR